MTRSRAVVLLTVLALLGGLTAAQAAGDIWGDVIMKQPFDTQPFREVKVPQWVDDLQVICYGLPPTDSEKFADWVKTGVDTGCVFFASPIYACYESKYLTKIHPSVPLDQIPKDIAAYKKAGIRIIGVVPPALIGEVYFAHPEWRRIGTNTTEIPSVDPVKEPYGGPLCLTGPWGDTLLDILTEIVTKFPDVSAWSFDGIHDYGVCYCKSCRDAYRP